MDSDQRRKRKRSTKPFSLVQLFSIKSLTLCFSFLIFLLFLSSHHWLSIHSFRPVLITSSSTLSHLSSYSSNSIFDSLTLNFSPRKIENRILFPDHILFITSNKIKHSDKLQCFYHKSSSRKVFKLSALSTDRYDEFRSIVRCPIPPMNYSIGTVELQRFGDVGSSRLSSKNGKEVHLWEKVVYEAALDGDTVVVFAKGLNLRPHKVSDPNEFRCHFGSGNSDKDEGGYRICTNAITAAQEIVRCKLPENFGRDSDKVSGIRVSISHERADSKERGNMIFPSVARISNFKSSEKQRKLKKYELCACTMVWNQASALSEWVMYHSWLGIEKWFIYDNNSDDGIEQVIEELNLGDHNVTRQAWPWIKTQEAGFSHCALKARDQCKWVGFFDVDEFFHFTYKYRLRQKNHGLEGRNALRFLVANFSSSENIAEIRTACQSFGPSGLTSQPLQGVTVGYTCRVRGLERHKSLVRPDLLDDTLLNVVHHFHLKKGFRYINLHERSVVINHYKYQAWESFRAKFFRRVSTYVVDWQEDQNKGSKDRAPGLGTVAVEPLNWRLRFCEVWDTGLRDYVLAHFADPVTRSLPWERTPLSSSY